MIRGTNRIGINLWNWVPGISADCLPLIGRAAAAGFTAVELPMTEPAVDNLELFKKEIEANNLEVSLCAALTAGRDLSNFDPVIRQNTVRYLKECIDTGSQIGAKIFAGPFYSGGGKCHLLDEEDRKREWNFAVHGIREVAAYAAEAGIELAVEPLHRYRTSVVNTVDQAISLISDINAGNVSIHFDTYHANIEETSITDALGRVLKHHLLGHFHACENNRGPPGSGHVPWKAIFILLDENKYRGHITMETFCSAAMDRCWYPLAENEDALAAAGIAFIKAQLAGFTK